MANKRNKSSSSQEEEFAYEPLDQLRVPVYKKDKTTKIVSALHIGFMSTREYVSYIPLPSLIISGGCCTAADEEEWLARMMYIKEDLVWLLRLPHHRFWSQVVYDEALQKCLQSYLSHCPRSYEMNFAAKENLLSRQRKVHQLVFSVFLRMSTHKESKMHHITPAVFGNIVYDNFLFDIPRMMDICALYGLENQPLVSKMIENLFKVQPKFFDDLDEACATMMLAFDTAEEQLQNLESKMTGALTNGALCSLSLTSLYELLDIVNYITDTSATFFMFLDCFLAAGSVFIKHGASSRIPSFYDTVIAEIENKVTSMENDGEKVQYMNTITSKLALSKTYLIKTFRNLLSGCIQAVLDAKCSSPDDSSHLIHLELYLQIVSEIAMGVIFKHDYNDLFPFEDDFELFSEAKISPDSTQVDYILGSVQSKKNRLLCDTNKIDTTHETQSESSKNAFSEKSITNLQDLAASLSINNVKSENVKEGATASKPPEAEIQSAIAYVLEFLPGLGKGYIETCLEHYNYDAEKTMDALLSQTLPQHLANMDKDMERVPDTNNDFPGDTTYSVLDERKNIFDHDEFDVFHHENVPMDRIHIGKNNKTPNAYEMLKTAPESTLLKELTLKYATDNFDSREESNLYDDEYDDTYDSIEVTVPERETETDLLAIRPFTVPRVFSSYKKENNQKIEDEEQEDKEEDTEATEPVIHRDQFCENPEDARRRYQHRQEVKQQHKNPRAFYRNNDQNTDKSQGSQSKGKSQGFQNKERHKSNVANHNRRKQSDYKRSRGMVP